MVNKNSDKMKYLIISLFATIGLISCSKEVSRPSIKGIVIDSITNMAISNALIRYEGRPTDETFKTNKLGYFSINGIIHSNLISLEGRDNDFKLIIFSPGYINDTINKGTRYGFSTDTIQLDTIKLIPVKN